MNDSPYVECVQCTKRVWKDNAFPVEKYFGEELGTKTIYFCNKSESFEYYLSCLRKDLG